ncbi:hypothetical protein OH76DRAFT_1365662 [Lentinus brumalis]|uniref:CCHC-type domain-containing protein n=1 Tax=Lentinus brumalis TaxID=2498619 RepID=A0A371CKG7_9APHY|nr:hypothetical protein OH76DRAFT_1365662 [Polyporus brumalis]
MSPSISKLDDSNYAEWSILMRAVLVRQGLWDVVSGDTPCPQGSPNSTALESVHQARGLGTRLARRRDLYQMRKRDDQTMTAWIADVRRAVFRLKAIGASITDEDHILVVTSSLPPSFEHFVVTLDVTPESELTLELVHRRLLNEDSRQHLFPSSSSTVALVATAAAARPRTRTPIELITCFYCMRKGHYKAQCPDLQPAAANAAVEEHAF